MLVVLLLLSLSTAMGDGKFDRGGGGGGGGGLAAVVAAIADNWRQKWLTTRALTVI